MKWLPVKDYEGLYEVSDSGLVRSVDRVLQVTNQKDKFFKGIQLSLNINKSLQYPQVRLWKANTSRTHYVHRLVAKAFVSNPLNKLEVNHINGIRTDNNVSNLEWATSSENSQHASDTGLRIYTNRLTEAEFLDCLQAVISGESYHSLTKRVPYQVPYLSIRLRKLAVKFGLEDLLNQSLYQQKVRRAQINGNPHLRATY